MKVSLELWIKSRGFYHKFKFLIHLPSIFWSMDNWIDLHWVTCFFTWTALSCTVYYFETHWFELSCIFWIVGFVRRFGWLGWIALNAHGLFCWSGSLKTGSTSGCNMVWWGSCICLSLNNMLCCFAFGWCVSNSMLQVSLQLCQWVGCLVMALLLCSTCFLHSAFW